MMSKVTLINPMYFPNDTWKIHRVDQSYFGHRVDHEGRNDVQSNFDQPIVFSKYHFLLLCISN
jgi:hypothetical protein